jgi:hypothetical protein
VLLTPKRVFKYEKLTFGALRLNGPYQIFARLAPSCAIDEGSVSNLVDFIISGIAVPRTSACLLSNLGKHIRST